MAVILVSQYSDSGGSGGGGDGHNHANLSLLNSLRTDSSGNLLFNGVIVGEQAVEVAYERTLTQEDINNKYLELPEDCDTDRAITLILENLPQKRGEDWVFNERESPEKDRIAWAGRGMERIAQAGDKVSINYYRKR
jgi:hypothetical protein